MKKLILSSLVTTLICGANMIKPTSYNQNDCTPNHHLSYEHCIQVNTDNKTSKQTLQQNYNCESCDYFIDENNDEVCDHQHQNSFNYPCFTDKNNDNACDNQQAQTNHQHKRHRIGHHH